MPPLNPPLWSMCAYANAWTQWGLKAKPVDHDRRFRGRYGLHEAPYANDGLPMGLHVTPGPLGKGIATDCLLCHAGRVAGQTIVGVGNAALDLQGLFDELYPADGQKIKLPVAFSHVRGTIDPVSPVAFLMEFRDLELNLAKPTKLEYFKDLASDPPAWWLLKKKRTAQLDRLRRRPLHAGGHGDPALALQQRRVHQEAGTGLRRHPPVRPRRSGPPVSVPGR